MTHAPHDRPLDPDDRGLPTLPQALAVAAAVVAAWALLAALAAACWLLVFAPRAGAEGAPLPAALARLRSRLEAPGVPGWKRDLLPRIEARRLGVFEANVTCYCPGRPDVDPPCGGPFAATGARLRWGHCAVDPAEVPLGSVLLVEGIDQLLVAVDTGGAIDGRDVDVCCPDPAHYRAMAGRWSYTKARCWVLRRGW